MATFDKVKPSASTDFVPIAVAATASPGTNFHTTGIQDATQVIDEITLVMANRLSTPILLIVEWGSDQPNGLLRFSLDPYEVRQYTGCLSGSGAGGRDVRVYVSSGGASAANIHGWVNRITL